MGDTQWGCGALRAAKGMSVGAGDKGGKDVKDAVRRGKGAGMILRSMVRAPFHDSCIASDAQSFRTTGH
jgi:hypothetical protein